MTGSVAEFIPGLELAETFYIEAVRPMLDEDFPDLRHSAALIGPGSEVLGFDTPMSMDHGWGPRLQVFISEEDHALHADMIRRRMGEKLPLSIRGFPTNFTEPREDRSVLMDTTETRPINHDVGVLTLRAFFALSLGIHPDREITVAKWLIFPQQVLRSVTAGAVFHDDLGLGAVRERLRWYPHDVWLYLLAAGWVRIAQEEAFVGRTGLEGDDLGSRIIASRLVRDLMRLCFLMEREYAPYSKWFGKAFSKLACARTLSPILERVHAAANWKERQSGLSDAYREAAKLHNALRITPPLPVDPSRFHDRPFLVIHAERFAKATGSAIEDLEVARIARKRLIGSIDQFSDSTDLAWPQWRRALRKLYEAD